MPKTIPMDKLKDFKEKWEQATEFERKVLLEIVAGGWRRHTAPTITWRLDRKLGPTPPMEKVAVVKAALGHLYTLGLVFKDRGHAWHAHSGVNVLMMRAGLIPEARMTFSVEIPDVPVTVWEDRIESLALELGYVDEHSEGNPYTMLETTFKKMGLDGIIDLVKKVHKVKGEQ